jgi:tricarballylate dehydrogenase
VTGVHTEDADVVVVGGGVAGLSAALAAAETDEAAQVILLDKGARESAGGNTRWTDAYFRLEDLYEVADGFVDDMLTFSGGRTDRAYAEELVRALPEAMEWVQGHGVRFRKRQTYFVTASRPRMMPDGGGEALMRALTAGCQKHGVDVRYATAMTGMERDGGGWRITTDGPTGQTSVRTRACVMACGGFEGDTERLRRHMGEQASVMKPIAPGGQLNDGVGIDLVVAAGGATSGEWNNFHGEPVDARSKQPEASVMVFPYGILVDKHARRFIDEGRGTVDETYEDLARAILRLDDASAFLISDRQLMDVPGVRRGLLTDLEPVTADTLEDLAALLGLDAGELAGTVREFNAAVEGEGYDPSRPDGARTRGLETDKTNWAKVLQEPPWYAYPLTTDIVFTYGGIATDPQARVLDEQGAPIPGLYAAGECTGVYYGKYPGATSVMRGLVFGKLAGEYAGGTLK